MRTSDNLIARYDVTKVDDPDCHNDFRHKLRHLFNNSNKNITDSLDERWK